MKKSDIIEAYVTIRKENQSIPDDVLDFMKDAAIEKLGCVIEIKTPIMHDRQHDYSVQKSAYHILQSNKLTEHGIAIEERIKEFYRHCVNDVLPKALALYQIPEIVPPYCQGGTLVSLKTSFLGQPIGTRCIVYHVDESGSAAIISDEGVEFGYFTEPEILEHLEFLKHTNLSYTFISVMRLMEDFRQGRFEQYFK